MNTIFSLLVRCAMTVGVSIANLYIGQTLFSVFAMYLKSHNN